MVFFSKPCPTVSSAGMISDCTTVKAGVVANISAVRVAVCSFRPLMMAFCRGVLPSTTAFLAVPMTGAVPCPATGAGKFSA